MYTEAARYYDLIHQARGRDANAEADVVLREITYRLPGVETLLDEVAGVGEREGLRRRDVGIGGASRRGGEEKSERAESKVQADHAPNDTAAAVQEQDSCDETIEDWDEFQERAFHGVCCGSPCSCGRPERGDCCIGRVDEGARPSESGKRWI